jgi:hypothetical protein
MKIAHVFMVAAVFAMTLFSYQSAAIDVEATAKALRLSNTITGGYMPASDPLFAQMVTKIQGGDLLAAATIASQSKYFASYLGRRLALQMQNPSLDAAGMTDNDATAFLIAHFAGTPTIAPSISTIWSENATYLVNAGGNQVHAADLTAAQLDSIDWISSLVKIDGQEIGSFVNNKPNAAKVALPAKHVGGYVTLSDRANDNSFAMFGATSGTNLRMIEGIWEIATGLTLMNVASTDGRTQDVPRFIPQYDPNFFQGQGQTACIACHGGGMSSINHGYATVADIFDYDPSVGFAYNAAPTTGTMKSLGSDPGKRNTVATCNLNRNPTAVCNPDSEGVGTVQAWDVSKTWSNLGILVKMGWTGPTSGQGLNELGSAIGKARIVYEFLVKRVVAEICPLGQFSSEDVASIAALANPFATPKGTDDIRTIVAKVATNETCL